MGTFEFIDNASISKKSRKVIRSHVMKGKNIGKSRASKPKPVLRSSVVHLSSATPVAVRQPSMTVFQSMLNPKVLLEIGDGLSGLRFAGHFPAQSRRIFQQFMEYVSEAIYPPEVCSPVNALDSIWFEYMVLDEAYFYCFMALAVSAVDLALGMDELKSPVKRRYFATAIRMLNHKLSMPDACADTSIAGVVNLALMAGMRADRFQMKLHLDGLCRMVDMRGGMKQLTHNFSLLEKIHRVDIEVALHYGCCPRFDAQTLGVMAPSKPMLNGTIPPTFLNLLRKLDFEVAVAASDIMNVTKMLNDIGANNKLDPLGFQDLVFLCLYQLIDIRTKSGLESFNHLDRAVLLGLTGFMTTMLVQFGRKRTRKYVYMAENLRAVMSEAELINTIDLETYLWLLFVTNQSAIIDEHISWLISLLLPVISQLDIKTWEGVHLVLQKYPWVDVFGNSSAYELWMRLKQT